MVLYDERFNINQMIKIIKINSFSKGIKISNVTRKYNLSHQNVFIRHYKYALWNTQQEAIQAGIERWVQ